MSNLLPPIICFTYYLPYWLYKKSQLVNWNMKQHSFYKHLTKHKRSMDLPLVGKEGLFDNGCFFLWNGNMDGRRFMCANPCTLNSLQVRCMGERKHHLQNLQQFQSKFELLKQGPWSEVKTKNISHWFWLSMYRAWKIKGDSSWILIKNENWNYLLKFFLSLIKMKPTILVILGWAAFNGTTQVWFHSNGSGEPILKIWQKI